MSPVRKGQVERWGCSSRPLFADRPSLAACSEISVSSLADSPICGKLNTFWGEQQAVAAFVAAACIFLRAA